MSLSDSPVDLTQLREQSVNQKIGQQKLFKLKDKEKKKEKNDISHTQNNESNNG